MRYHEFTETADNEKQQIDAQKKRAQQMTKNAKRATQMAKAADLTLKQKRTQQTLAKINIQP